MFKFKHWTQNQFTYRALASALIALGLSLGGATTASAQAAKVSVGSRIAESPFKNAVHFSQHYSLTGQLTVQQKRGPVTKTSSDYGIVQNVVETGPTDFGGMPRAMAAPNSTAEVVMTQEEALKKSAAWAKSYAPSVASDLAVLLNKTASGMGILTYSEDIKVSREEGEPVNKVVSFIMSVDRSGKAIWGAPVLTTPDPDVLYAMYSPKNMGDDMKERNDLEPPGSIQYYLADNKGNRKTDLKTIDVWGAFDARAGDTSKVPCLMDRRNSGCSVGMAPTDIYTLMNKYAAESAIVDYVNQVVPVYDPIPGSNSDEPEYRPRMAVSYTDRTYDCKIYTNEGLYGFVLEITSDRYLAMLNGKDSVDYYQIGQQQYQGISSVGNFKKSVPVTDVTGNPKNSLISPVLGDQTVFRYDEGVFSFLMYVAPVRLTGTDDFLEKANNDNPVDFPLIKVSDIQGLKTYSWGLVGNDLKKTGTFKGSLTFNLDDPSGIETFSISDIHYDDWIIVYVNKSPVVIAPEGYKDFNYSDTRMYECEELETSYKCQTKAGEQIFKKNPPTGEAYCIKADDTQASYYCGTTLQCAETLVSTIDLYGNVGCKKAERETNFVISGEQSLKPRLRSGTNELSAKLLVAKEGEFWSTLTVKGCGANFDLDMSPTAPAVPESGSAEAILDRLHNSTDAPLEKPKKD